MLFRGRGAIVPISNFADGSIVGSRRAIVKSINLSGLRDRKRVLTLLNEGEPFKLTDRKKVIAHFIPVKLQPGLAADCRQERPVAADDPEKPESKAALPNDFA